MFRFVLGCFILAHTTCWATGELFMCGETVETSEHVKRLVQIHTIVEPGVKCQWQNRRPIVLIRFGEFGLQDAEGWARYIASYDAFKTRPFIEVNPHAKWDVSYLNCNRYTASLPIHWQPLAQNVTADAGLPAIDLDGALVMPPVHVTWARPVPGLTPLFSTAAADPFFLHLRRAEFVFVENRWTPDHKATPLFDISWN